ncbi:SDR family NAD(P)-dependent oxidoreductase [Tundrisphaera lichenicola]|uniref:SDR family NAD(P)-dependent oxidoreductase n=1 Tax=Tundrisphaera lichenicola TaxID=2029860 RepID=UPI003EBC92F2
MNPSRHAGRPDPTPDLAPVPRSSPQRNRPLNPADRTPSVPVAIIGMGCLFPRADGLRRYWANIAGGVDAIREIPETHWNPDDYHDADPKSPDRTYARRGGFLDPVDFPALEFGIAPTNLDATDTTQLLGLMVAKAALDDAGYGERGGRSIDRERVSVLLGVTGTLELVIPLGARLGHPIWRRALKEAGVAEPVASEVVRRISDSYVGWQENSFPGLLGNVAAGRIANRLDLGGTNCVVDAACASSLGAVHLALMELAAGRSDVVLTGGLDTFNDIFMYMCFSKTPALSPTGDARPFSAAGDGTTLGEGLGVLTLKRLDDARRDGDRIYAVIKGIGSSSDGKGNAVYAPSAAGQVKCLRRAYESAGVTPDTIELVEAHGTGTKVGDAVELSALAEVYRSSRPEGTWCALGSVKSQIGHTKAAAGAAGLIKAALALHHKVLPPTIKVDRPAEGAAPGTTPFYVNTEARPWLKNPGHPRRAAVSAFGFGGSNFHCVLEEAEPEPTGVDWDGDTQILAFSGKTPEAIRSAIDALPAEPGWEALRASAATARSRFLATDPHRLLIVAELGGIAWPKLAERARSLLNGPTPSPIVASPEGVYYGSGTEPGGLAVLFPGQGSQYVGMLRDLACKFPEIHRVLDESNSAGPIDGQGLGDWIYPHPSFDEEGRKQADRKLRSTQIAQPAIGAASLGAYRVLERFGLKADAMAGHSFGELTALCASKRIDPESFSELARLRGRLMAGQGGDRGSMLAALAPVEAIEAALAEEKLDLVIANRNAPKQSIVSGPTAEIARAADAFARRGIATRPLEVSAAFHSRFVEDATGPLLEAMEKVEFSPSSLPIFANTTAETYPDDPDLSRTLLAHQLARPVRFVEQVGAMAKAGIRTFLEVGPDAKLTGMVGAILEGQPHQALALDASRGKRGNVADLARALSQLAAMGHAIHLTLWDEGAEPTPDVARKPALTVKVSGANFAPKPPAPRPRSAPPAPTPEPLPKMNPEPADRKPTRLDSLPSTEHRAGRNGSAPANTNGHASITRTEPRPIAPAPRQESAPTPVQAPFLVEAIRASQENLVAFQRLGEQTANLHRQYLEGQDRATQTFQSLVEHQQRLTLASLGMVPTPTPAPIAPAPRSIEPPVMPVPAPLPAATPLPPQVSKPIPAPVPQASNGTPSTREIAPPPAPPVKLTPTSPNRDSAVHAALVEVVSEKTGYPAEVLEPGMQLDADLGIDSIKRVEILAALQERLPEAPVIGPEHLGTIRTLGQIAEFLGGTGGSPSPAPAPAPASVSNASAIHAALVEVVSEKTGYPAEVLEPGMQLDADLGIDSIKRVEILAALQERLPEAPVIGPEHLGTIRTLGQIAEFLGGSSGSTTPAPASVSNASAVHQALIEVVSEKTGYPAEVLEPGMQLDADLGIDSIKRVEILAALQERLPEAPVIGPEHLGTIRTLGQIAEFLGGTGGSPSPTPVVPSPATPPIERPAHEPVRRLIPSVVTLDASANRESIKPPAGGMAWVLDDGSSLAGAIATRLEGLGLQARLIAQAEIGSIPAPERLAGLVLLAPASGIAPSAIPDAFRLLRLAAPALRNAGGGSAVVTVTRLGGTFGLGGLAEGADPASGGLAGLSKTAGHEWPEVLAKAIDLDPALPAEDAAQAIVDEMFRRGPAEVGLSKSGRSGIVLKASPLSDPSSSGPFAPGDVVVVSGGARGVTAEVARSIAEAFRPTVVILGRSPEPSPEPDWLASLSEEPEIKRALHARLEGPTTPQAIGEAYRKLAANREVLANIARIEQAGSKVVYRSLDVRDAGEVRSTLAAIRSEFGPIRGLVHGAGVLADRKIEDQTDEQFARVFETKVKGLDALLGAIEADELKALVLFSSTTARFGRAGQVAYASANEVLNKRAQAESRSRPGCRVVSVNWGPWDGGMVTPSLRPLFEAEGIPLIPTGAGARYLVEELRGSGESPVEVVILGGGGPDPAFLRPTVPTPAAEPEPASGMAPVFERPLDVASTPILRSHVIDGRPVLPMALILEWMAQGAMSRNPGLACCGVDNLRVLKGVVVREALPETIRVLAARATRRDGHSVVPVELRGVLADGREVLHARGEVVLGDRHPETPSPIEEPDLLPYATTRREIYRDILFHGPGLQGIVAVEGCGDLGIAATVEAAPAPSDWVDRPLRQQWLTDPLALDCAFQMMILWSVERTGDGSLPTFVGRYRQFRKSFPGGGVRVVARITEASPHKARADVDFLDEQGEAVARIEDYECVIDASLKSAFRRNRAQVESK